MGTVKIDSITNSLNVDIEVQQTSPESGNSHNIAANGGKLPLTWSGASITFDVTIDGVPGNTCTISEHPDGEGISVQWGIGSHNTSGADNYTVALHRSYGEPETDGIVVVGSLDIDDETDLA